MSIANTAKKNIQNNHSSIAKLNSALLLILEQSCIIILTINNITIGIIIMYKYRSNNNIKLSNKFMINRPLFL